MSVFMDTGLASRPGRLRCVNRHDGYRLCSDEVHTIAWLPGLAQVPLTRQEHWAAETAW